MLISFAAHQGSLICSKYRVLFTFASMPQVPELRVCGSWPRMYSQATDPTFASLLKEMASVRSVKMTPVDDR